MRRASSSDAARARSMSSGRIGTIGTTSAAPIRGCTPSWRRRSIRSRATAMPGSERVDELALVADEREDRPVVVGVRVDVEQLRALRERPADLLDHRGVAALREVRYGFERQRHSSYSRTRGDRVRAGAPRAGIAAARPRVGRRAERAPRRGPGDAPRRGREDRVGLPRRRVARLLHEGRRTSTAPGRSTPARSTRSTRTTSGSRTRPSPSETQLELLVDFENL